MPVMLLAIVFYGFSADKTCVVNVEWTSGIKPVELKLYRVTDGRTVQVAAAAPDPDGKFRFTFTPDSGAFHVVGMNDIREIGNYTVYLKPGDRLDMLAGDKGWSPGHTCSPENAALYEWYGFMRPLTEITAVYRSDKGYQEFFPLLEQKTAAAPGWVSPPTGNAAFDRAFEGYRQADLAFAALSFLSSGSLAKAGKDVQYPSLYKNMDIRTLAVDNIVPDYPYGMLIISLYRYLDAPLTGRYTEEELVDLTGMVSYLDVLLPQITGSRVRSLLVMQSLRGVTTRPGAEAFAARYGGYLDNDSLRNALVERAATMPGVPKDGKEAFDLRLPDVKGEEHSLSDYRGKVVYVDFWATWCGPCMAESPHFEKLIHEYAGRDVVFIGVSLDDAKTRDAWAAMLTSKNLGGVQLLASDRADEQVNRPFGIMGIPHFILVDRQGRLVYGSAPRPSSFDIRPVLDALIEN